jgi:hypothetical protein
LTTILVSGQPQDPYGDYNDNYGGGGGDYQDDYGDYGDGGDGGDGDNLYHDYAAQQNDKMDVGEAKGGYVLLCVEASQPCQAKQAPADAALLCRQV